MSDTLMEVFVELAIQTLYAIYILLTIFVPVILGYLFFKTWVKYARAKFIAGEKHTLLEFRLPKEITKSPIAMEVFMNSLFQTSGEGNWYDKFVKGGMRAWFSLEMVSIEGQVHFFIWTREKLRKTIETQLYSQYPDVEVAVVEDYVMDISYDPERNDMWGCYFVKVKDSFYPIKTYVDYGLDRDPKEELKIDPITPVIEILGSLSRGEQMWIQIMIRAHKKEIKKPGTWREMVDWTFFAKEEIKKKMKRDKGDGESADKMTKGEKQAVEAIERSISKAAFDCAIRGIYIADKDFYNKSNQAGLVGTFKQYGTNDLNAFKPDGTTSFDYPWQDFRDMRLKKKKKELFEAYRTRGIFPPLYKPDGKSFVMSSEELATIYHFPGKVAKTPTFTRLPSRKGDAPSNLPI